MPHLPQFIRVPMAYIVSPWMASKGFTFSKQHRHENTWQYQTIDTILANRLAYAINPCNFGV